MPTRKFKRYSALVAGVTMAVALTGCSGGGGDAGAAANEPGDWESIVEAASGEGEIIMYVAWLPTAIEAVEKEFEKAYPDIDLQITRVLPPDVDAALDAELEAGQAPDIVSNTNYAWIAGHVDDFVTPVGPDATSAEWEDYLLDGKLQVANISALGITYNTDLIAAQDAPKNYEDLLDPKFKGKLGIADNLAGPQADMYEWLDETYPGFTKALAKQDPKVYSTAVPIQEALQQGEIEVALWGSNALVQAAKEQGAAVEWVLPEPGWGPPNLTYLLPDARHPNAAQVLYNWLATVDGQSAAAKNDITALKGVPGTAGDASSLTVLDYKRVTADGWLESAQSSWRETFGR